METAWFLDIVGILVKVIPWGQIVGNNGINVSGGVQTWRKPTQVD